MKDKSDAGVTCGADSQAALHKDIIAPAMTLGTSSIFLSLRIDSDIWGVLSSLGGLQFSGFSPLPLSLPDRLDRRLRASTEKMTHMAVGTLQCIGSKLLQIHYHCGCVFVL